MIRAVIATVVTLFGPPIEHTDPDLRMEALFGELFVAPDESEARFVAEEIEAIWAVSGDASADLLLFRATAAIEAGDAELARRLVDGALELAPEFADAWARSAIIAVATEDIGLAVEHVNQALVFEPRHYEALLTLGLLLERLERHQGAYEAYEKVLELYPLHPLASDLADEIERDALGRDL